MIYAIFGAEKRRLPIKAMWTGLTLSVALGSISSAWATVLPDACGADDVKFNVTNRKGQPAPAGLSVFVLTRLRS
jgi:hypothetical protein